MDDKIWDPTHHKSPQANSNRVNNSNLQSARSIDYTRTKNIRPDMGDILTLNSPNNKLRAAPLPLESQKNLEFVKRRGNILGSLVEQRYEVIKPKCR